MRQFINIVLVSSFILVSGVVAAAPPLDYDQVEAPRADLVAAHAVKVEQAKAHPVKGEFLAKVEKTEATNVAPSIIVWRARILDPTPMTFDNEDVRNLIGLAPASVTKSNETAPDKVAKADK